MAKLNKIDTKIFQRYKPEGGRDESQECREREVGKGGEEGRKR